MGKQPSGGQLGRIQAVARVAAAVVLGAGVYVLISGQALWPAILTGATISSFSVYHLRRRKNNADAHPSSKHPPVGDLPEPSADELDPGQGLHVPTPRF